MPPVRVPVRELLWHPSRESHIAQHRITPREVQEVCSGDPIQLPGHTARILLVGPTRQGRMLATVLEHYGEGVYFVVTARRASGKELDKYQLEKGGDGHA